MLALWIALAVVLVAALVFTSVLFVRRGGGRGAPAPERPPGRKADQPAEAERPSGIAVLEPPPGVPEAPVEAEAPPASEAPPAAPAQTPSAPAQTPSAPPAGPEAEVVEPTDAELADVLAPAKPPELRERMGKTRGLFAGYVRSLRSRGSVDEQTWEELEEALLRADVGIVTTTQLLDDLRARVKSGELRGPDAVLDGLKGDLRDALVDRGDGELAFDESATNVWLFVGVNGVGKTTTIGKVARRQIAEGRSVILAAGDTFRAAAAEQLTMWADRSEAPIVRGAEGGDPSAVVFDAVQRAAARGHNLVLADTAGRLHTKVNLVEELKKIRRIADRPPGVVQEVLLVLDATTGQNGLTQARQFLDAVQVTGVVLTKLDGSAKGGIVIAIERELGLPVKLVGLGEGVDDLVPFDPAAFVDALFD